MNKVNRKLLGAACALMLLVPLGAYSADSRCFCTKKDGVISCSGCAGFFGLQQPLNVRFDKYRGAQIHLQSCQLGSNKNTLSCGGTLGLAKNPTKKRLSPGALGGTAPFEVIQSKGSIQTFKLSCQPSFVFVEKNQGWMCAVR